MSRGGRGGARGGGYGGPPGSRLNHGTVPFEISPELLAHSDQMTKETGLFPHMDIPRPKPLSKREFNEVEGYIELRTKRQLGPYYLPSTAADRNVRGSRTKLSSKEKASFDAFADQPTWYSKQEEARRLFKIEQFKELPWKKELLPKELWGVTGLATGPQYWPTKRGDEQSNLTMSEKQKEQDAAEKEERKQGKATDDTDRSEKDPEDADDDPVSDKDDDYSDDEDDMAADYNAEQYFDGGEEEGDDIDGNDGGGADDY